VTYLQAGKFCTQFWSEWSASSLGRLTPGTLLDRRLGRAQSWCSCYGKENPNLSIVHQRLA